jgi:lysozyme
VIPSLECYALIKRFEQFRPTAYKPTRKDRWTCGWGHTAGVTASTTCTQNTAQEWLIDDTRDAYTAVNNLVTVPLTQHQFDALTCFVFNVGVGNFEESTLLRELNDREYEMAANEMLKWDHQGRDVLVGLERRDEAERALFLSGGVAAPAASVAG